MTPRRLTGSLTARVVGVFVVLVALVAAGLGTYLYRSFVREIERKDDIQLLGKLRQVQLLLGNAATPDILRERPQYFRDTMSGQENALVRITAGDGALLLDINPDGERPGAPRPVPAGLPLTPDALADWTSRTGYPGRAVAGMASLGGVTPVTVLVARHYAGRSDLFAAYRARIALAALGSAVLAALLAAALLRRGLSPLRSMARHAGQVRPGQPALPLDGRAAPSELLPLIDAFNAMLARLQESYARLSQFSADLAHEFRTPVTNLLGQSEVLLARPRSGDEYVQLVESNVEELQRLSRMIESMLFLARAEREQGHEPGRPGALDRAPLAVQDEFRRLAEFFDGMAEERGVAVVCEGGGTVPADAQLLRRALGNLLSNAIRHAEPGGQVALLAQAVPGWIVLSVRNTGPTIAPHHLPHLFERFYRADPARSGAAGSTGLGLAIVAAIAQLHGGSAEISSAGGVTTASLRLPAG